MIKNLDQRTHHLLIIPRPTVKEAEADLVQEDLLMIANVIAEDTRVLGLVRDIRNIVVVLTLPIIHRNKITPVNVESQSTIINCGSS